MAATRLLLAALVLGCGGGTGSPQGTPTEPEPASGGPTLPPGTPVVLISIDTLRSDRLPAYGYDAVETPAIDALRDDAILFERAYSQMALTLPSHTSILSGLWPVDHGVRDNVGYRVGDDLPMLQDILADQGYTTIAGVSAFVLRGTTGIARGFDVYDDDIAMTSGTELGGLQRPGMETLARITEPLERAVQADETPFLFFHIYEPHTPNDPPEPFRSRYASAYDGEVAEADLVIGRLVAELRRLGLYDDALVLLLSDHGEGLGDHGEYEHEVLLYREILQVPMLLKLPGGLRAGTTVEEPVQLVDVLPTVLGLLDLPLPEGPLRGRSMLASAATPRAIFSESVYPRIHFGWSDLASMIEGRFHYIEGPDPELYDLLEDPGETVNLLQEQRPLVRRLSAALAEIDRSIEPPAQVDEETRERMLRLGYVGGGTSREGPLPDPKTKIHVLEDLGAAAAAMTSGRLEEAVRRYRAVVEADPEMAYGWEQLGKAERRRGHPERALEAYAQAIAVSPTGSGPAALSIAEIQLEAGRLDEAREHAAIAAATQDAAHDLLAQIALQQGDLEEARRHLDTALARRSGRVEPLITEVSLLVRQERFEDALEVAAVALREFGDRDDLEALEGLEFERGRALARLGRADDAEAAFRTEIRRSPDELAPYTHLALLLALGDRPREAVTTLQTMVEVNDRPDAYLEAARTLSTLGLPDAAESLLRSARSRFPGTRLRL